MEGNRPHRLGFTTSAFKPVASAEGGLVPMPVSPGSPVLNRAQIEELNRMGGEVERVLGPQPHGWDIEWVVDESDRVILLQARPNM